jgi:hypothetical protein
MDYHILFYGGMAGALIALILAVFLYIKLNIPQVVKDLTGISLPGAARIASAQKFAHAEQTGRITNEIQLRKSVDVAGAERTLTMESQQKHTATKNLGQGSAAITREGTPQPAKAPALAPLFPLGEKKEAGDTVLLEHAGGLVSSSVKETTLLQDSAEPQHQAASLREETALLVQLHHAEDTALLQDFAENVPGETAALQNLADTGLLGGKTAPQGPAQTELLGETAMQQGPAETGLLGETTALQSPAPTEFLGETRLQHEPAETALLTDIEETMLLSPADETTGLTELETTLLAAAAQEEELYLYFKKEVDIMVVHTKMTI